MKIRFYLNICILSAVCALMGTTVFANEVADTSKATTAESEANELAPVYATDLKDGSYEIEVDSSSSMFNIVKCTLNVEDGEMTADLTLSGKGYLYLYMGTGQEAEAADEGQYIGYSEDADGAYVYTVDVLSLNEETDCAAFSKRKEKWYDRTLVFEADNLPKEAYLWEYTDLEDGTYQVDVALSGGSGRSGITSPTSITVTEGRAVASILWSSPNYDYMIVNGQKYLPTNEAGENSAFEIPVLTFDLEMTVIADTVAMSTPHEIEYKLIFDSSSIKKDSKTTLIVVAIVAVVAILAIVLFIRKKKKH